MKRCVRLHVPWRVDAGVRACMSPGRLRGKECVIARAMESRYRRARLHVLWAAQAEGECAIARAAELWV